MSKKIIILWFICMLPALMLAIAEEKYLPDVPYYYGSFSGYQIPFKASQPLTYEEAVKRDAYYIAYYDEQGRIISFTKYLHGKMVFSDKYFYRPSGVIERREMTKSTDEIIIHYFDEKGKLIKESESKGK